MRKAACEQRSIARLLSVIWLLPLIFIAFATGAYGQQQHPPLSPSERAELDVYRQEIPKYLSEIKKLRSDTGYQQYAKKFWIHKSDMLDTTLAAFNWQRFASNTVLLLVVIITIGGVALAAYQLHLSYRIGQKVDAQTLDISAQRAQVTSSVVGVTILVIAGAFLLLFLQNVYSIDYVQNNRSESAPPLTPE